MEKTITLENNYICLRCPYSDGMKKRIMEIPGRLFIREDNCWKFPAAPMYAVLVVAFGNEMGFDISLDVLKLSRFTLNPIIKQDRSLLYPFQEEAVDFIHKMNGNCLVSDACGLGKSVESLWAIKEWQNTTKVLIVSPASVIYKWQDEVKKWLGIDAYVIKTTKQDIPKGDYFLIMSYDILTRVANKIDNYRFDLMICDECHYITNHKTRRANAVKAIHAKGKLMLSGTPFLNRPIELWNILNTLNPYRWQSWGAFATKYANGHKDRYGHFDVSGASNIPELKQLLEPIMIRRLKKDVLKDLPDLTRTILPVDVDTTEYNFALKNLRVWLAEQGKVTVTPNALSKLNYLRQLVGKAKINAAVEFADDFLNDSDERKLVLYAHHKEVVTALVDKLQKWGVDTIVGDDSNTKRADTIRRFQEKVLPRVLVISSAGGEGVDLWRADTLLFVESEWNMSKMEQVEGRLHRIGQCNPVNSYKLIANDTIDWKIHLLLQEKSGIINGVIGGTSIEEIILNDIVKGV